MMEKYGLLVDYGRCDGCQKCVAACCRVRGCTRQQSGLKLSEAGPYRFPSGRTETYFVATPTDFCDCCAAEDAPACALSCPDGCISFGKVELLGTRMTQKKVALFTLTGSLHA